MINLQTVRLRLRLHRPEDGFYQGTRFDRSGVFDSLLYQGTELCGRWFEQYDPCMHDAVCGPAEEFSPVFLPDGRILKIGVGLLLPDVQPYDRFHLYPVADGGIWSMEETDSAMHFRHHLEGFYDYVKTVSLTGENAFEICHELDAFTPLEGEVYNHNFFTLGKMSVGPSRTLDFPFTPEGTWRAAYDSIAFGLSGLRFSRPLEKGESVFTGNIHEKGSAGMPYRLTLSEGPLQVRISGDVPVLRTVFWSNHRIACPEPYNAFRAIPGKPFRWTVRYEILKSQGR